MELFENYLQREIDSLQSGTSVAAVTWMMGGVYDYTIPVGTGILVVTVTGDSEGDYPEVAVADGVEGQQVLIYNDPASVGGVALGDLGQLGLNLFKRGFFVLGAWRY